jgi:hypothetical protein
MTSKPIKCYNILYKSSDFPEYVWRICNLQSQRCFPGHNVESRSIQWTSILPNETCLDNIVLFYLTRTSFHKDSFRFHISESEKYLTSGGEFHSLVPIANQMNMFCKRKLRHVVGHEDITTRNSHEKHFLCTVPKSTSEEAYTGSWRRSCFEDQTSILRRDV